MNRRWAVIAGLGVVELWVVGLIVRSIAGGGHHAVEAAVPAAPAVYTSPAFTRADIDRTILTSNAPSVIIDAAGFALNVAVRAGRTVSVRELGRGHGWMRENEQPLDIRQSAGGVTILRPGNDTDVMFFGSNERRLEVIVPPDARLDVRNAGATTVAGLRADATLHSEDGSIMVSDHAGALHVTTDDGSIELVNVAGSAIEAGSHDGHITFDRVRADRVAVTAGDGSIDIVRSLLHGGKIQTEDGRVALGIDPLSNVTISASSSSGEVNAQTPLQATAGGDDDDAPKSIRIGDGYGRLDVGSDDGSISIRTSGVDV